MKSILAFILLLFLSNVFFGQEKKEELVFNIPNISKKEFDFSTCKKGTYKKCFNKVEPGEIFSFIGVSDSKSFRKFTLKQTKNFIVANIDEEIFLAAINNNKIKFEKPYLNLSYWVNEYGKPDIRFFGSNISENKSALKKLKFIVSQIYYDKRFHADFERMRNKQITLFIPLGKTNESKYIIEERTKEEKALYNSKGRNTFPPYYKSCNSLENSSEYNTKEKKEGIKKCMEYQHKSFLINNFNKELVRKSITKLKTTQNISKPKFKAWVSFKINEYGRPCEYQASNIIIPIY